MAEITAAAVKALRERTGLPMMECKKALQESGGDETAAIDWLRKQNIKTQETRLGRETSAGRLAIHTTASAGAIVELLCESAPVASSPDVVQFAGELAQQLATGPGAATPADLLKQGVPGEPGRTLAAKKDDLFNRIREVFNVGRIARFDGQTVGYVHHTGDIAALVEYTGGDPAVAKDVAMHIAASNPQVVSKEDLDPEAVNKEREIQMAAARSEGKPESIIAKMVEGRLKNFYAAQVLLEQPFVKDDKKTVGQMAKEAKVQIKRFVRWQLGKS